jgi:hypothetical protein
MGGTFACILYLQFYKPDLFKRLILSVDIVGITEIGKAEKSRLSTINTLPITYEEKQVLVNHTVFLGATPEMVMLSLGNPREQRRYRGGDVLVYYDQDDPRPTLLQFERGKLTRASKGSALDLSTPETAASSP